MKLLSASSRETIRLGEKLGKKLRAGDVLALSGELGAGKTTLVRGIAKGLGVSSGQVSSPTFALVHEYEGREKLYHIDWYRLKAVRGKDKMLAEEILSSGAVTLIEWPERGKDCLSKETLHICLRHKGGDRREISLKIPASRSKDFSALSAKSVKK